MRILEMSYIDKNLMKDEHIIYRSKRHWVVFLWPAIWFVFLSILLIKKGFSSSGNELFIVVAVLPVIVSYINVKTSDIGLTDKRVIFNAAFIRRNSFEVSLDTIKSIQVIQGVVAKILGFGSIEILRTNGIRDTFHRIDAPFVFIKKVQDQISAVQERMAGNQNI